MGKRGLFLGKKFAFDPPLNLEFFNVLFFESQKSAGEIVGRDLMLMDQVPKFLLVDVEKFSRLMNIEVALFD